MTSHYLVKEANFEALHFNDLRHTFSANLLLSGADLKDVKEIIGRSAISMADLYSHQIPNHKHGLQKKLAEHYANESSQPDLSMS